MCYNYTASCRPLICHSLVETAVPIKYFGVTWKLPRFTPLSAYSTNVFQQNSVQKCMTIMCIIVTEEDLCKKHVTKSALFCQYAFLPQKCCPAAVKGTFSNDSKYHICPYNCNTRTGFWVDKKIWGSRELSSALLDTPWRLSKRPQLSKIFIVCPSISSLHWLVE